MTSSEGTVALVTGATRGIGREVAVQLARRGWHVLIGARHPDRGLDVAKALRNSGGDVRVWPLDVADQVSVEAAAARLADTFGRLDVLVNNAGVDYDTDDRAIDADLGRAHDDLEVNLFGAWRVTQAFAPMFRAGARVVNVSSGAGSFSETAGSGGIPIYSITKAALNMLTVKLAADLALRSVLVNAVCPGWVATDMGGPGGRPLDQGAASVLHAVDLPSGGNTGAFLRDGRPVPW